MTDIETRARAAADYADKMKTRFELPSQDTLRDILHDAFMEGVLYSQHVQSPVVAEHVAWCRYVDDGNRIVLCDSDAKGAFKVYAASNPSSVEAPQSESED